MDSARLRSEISAYFERQCFEFEILQLNFFENWLLKVRDQKKTGSCMFIAVVACTEMLCRKSKIKVVSSKQFYLDVQDVFENLYKVYPDEPKAKDRYGKKGASPEDVMTYAIEHGLLVTSECRNPCPKNFFSHCCQHPPRQKILSFTELEAIEAFEFARHTPIVACMDNAYDSLDNCEEVIYQGPYDSELAKGPGDGHAMVIVGNATIRIDSTIKNFFVLQNCYGKTFGCEGYVLMPTHLFDDFWLPILTLQQLSLQQLKKKCKELM